ncbi:MAG TPA: hypothetical protein VMW16_16335 [Sedimentisphaerales bacterium]|nr:hypothetical protein [Sedimentisphaerales bacterium]
MKTPNLPPPARRSPRFLADYFWKLRLIQVHSRKTWGCCDLPESSGVAQLGGDSIRRKVCLQWNLMLTEYGFARIMAALLFAADYGCISE